MLGRLWRHLCAIPPEDARPGDVVPYAGLSWSCHFCGDERPDALVGVVSRQLRGLPVEGKENRRYCIDRPECRKAAADWQEGGISGSTYGSQELARWARDYPAAATALVTVLAAIAGEHERAPVVYEDRQDSEVLRDVADDIQAAVP